MVDFSQRLFGCSNTRMGYFVGFYRHICTYVRTISGTHASIHFIFNATLARERFA
jgi:hypothetical protein